MFETPGIANITLETLAKIAAGLRCGVMVKFVPFSEMLRWENSFSPSTFDVVPRLEHDQSFLSPVTESVAVSLAAGMGTTNQLAELKKKPEQVNEEGLPAAVCAAGAAMASVNSACGGTQ